MNEAAPQAGTGGSRSALLSRYALAIIFVLAIVVAALAVPNFATWANIANVLQRNSIIGIVACGMLLMIVLGGFDLSVGAVGAMASVVAAAMIVNVSGPLGIVVALGLGALVGLLNGFCIAKVGINPFVATLGTQVLITGLLFIGTAAQPVYGVPEGFTVLGLGRIGPIPIPTIIFAAIACLTWAILRFTTFGHHIYAVGGNKVAARLAGVNVDRITLATYA
ncbi:ABC transporter permease, partial [Mesorhizobium sp. M2C.T.Ca.TU.002.02.1.1]|uniref:ABC transporter permease n=1 Tax=Mesorhizobium sp. M2C.T.Ca.TU.002.02.1.1 TaxID=2496788 RepID=UPI000FD3C22E